MIRMSDGNQVRAFLYGLMIAGAATLTACSRQPQTSAPAPVVAAAASKPAVPIPTLADQTPLEYPGLHNVVAYTDSLISGSVPEGDVAFETLNAMGIKTIISVDGAVPDVESARQHGLRYVHLPIGYNGMDKDRTLEIARAVRDLPGPVYLHCHHGKHRSAGAAGAVAVTLGELTSDQATARMHVSGTASNYTGLYQCVAIAVIATVDELNSASSDFPEVWKTSGLVKSMVEVDEAFEHLKLIEKSAWSAPADHPDLVPAAEAGRLADLMRHVQDDDRVKSKPAELSASLQSASQLASALEEELLKSSPDPAALSAQFKLINTSCKDCHAKWRD